MVLLGLTASSLMKKGETPFALNLGQSCRVVRCSVLARGRDERFPVRRSVEPATSIIGPTECLKNEQIVATLSQLVKFRQSNKR